MGIEGTDELFDEEHWLREMAEWGSIILPDPDSEEADADFPDEELLLQMGGGMSGTGLLTQEELDKLPEAQQIAYRIRHTDEWNPEDYRQLCELANLADEYDAAQEDEEIDAVVAHASALLGILYEG